MERLSTQTAAQDANACIALCYQLNQPLNVQAVDSQTAVAVQSLLDSQAIAETQEEEEDIFQCGKCKKQFTSLSTFVNHKQTQCAVQQQQQPLTIQQPQHQQLTLGTSSNTFTNINLNRQFSQTAINGAVSTINTSAPILQAHPCLTRSLNQPSNAATLTLSGVPSSPISQLSQNMVFTDDLMALTNLDTSSLGAQTIQMVTGPIHGQAVNNSNGVTIFSPITSLATTPNSFSQTTGPGQLLVQPAQHITLTTISDKTVHQQQTQQLQPQQLQPQQLSQPMPPPPAPAPQTATITVSPAAQQTLQTQGFKPSPTKADRKSAQNNFITVLNPDNSVSLLSTRKGKTARNAKNNVVPSEEDSSTKSKLKCDYCSKRFTKNFDLQQHIRAHTGEKPFQCIVCGRAFAQKSNVKKHMATHKVWPCGTSNTLPKQPDPVIEDKESEPALLSTAALIAPTSSLTVTTTPTPATVIGTSSSFTNQQIQELVKSPGQHANIQKSQSQTETEEEGSKVKVVVDNSYICQYCPAKFKTYYQLKTHLVKHKSEQVYKCVMKNCGQSFHDLDAFLEHVKSHENEMSYRCHQCHKYFKTLHDLGVHQYSHIYMNQGVKSGPRHFQCTKCGNKYTTPEALEHHMSTTSHNYKCPHCSKQFTCERFLRRHLPIHGSEGQFECQQCKKRFKTEHYLKSHILIHTGETPFVCEICQAAFNRKDKLKRHMTIHDSIKKYRCPFRNIQGCMKEFNRPDKLKAHIITHSSIKPYKCSICGKGFSRRPHLVEHERGHNLDYRFKCEKCQKGFFRPKLFNEHKCQPSQSGVQQQFRPRNRRKIGRPRKRMISIAPDSLSKSRGKQYPSRTRPKGKVVLFPTEAVKQQVHQQAKQIKIDSAAVAGNGKSSSEYQEANTLSVEVVKGLPVMNSSVKATGIIEMDSDGAMSVHIAGLEAHKDESVAESFGQHVQQISLGPGGELLDHYVVHLTESVDGSGPTIQTAFIPAVSGSQIFANTANSMSIQPIAIIEARSFNVAAAEHPGTHILTTDESNAMLNSSHGQVSGAGSGYITVAETSQDAREVKSELQETGTMIMLAGGNANREGGLMVTHGSDMMVAGTNRRVTDTSGLDVHVQTSGMVASQMKEEPVLVIGNHGMMVATSELSGQAEAAAAADMMSLFAAAPSADSYVGGGQVVVSRDQTYITCSSNLLDYSTADTVLQGPR